MNGTPLPTSPRFRPLSLLWILLIESLPELSCPPFYFYSNRAFLRSSLTCCIDRLVSLFFSLCFLYDSSLSPKSRRARYFLFIVTSLHLFSEAYPLLSFSCSSNTTPRPISSDFSHLNFPPPPIWAHLNKEYLGFRCPHPSPLTCYMTRFCSPINCGQSLSFFFLPEREEASAFFGPAILPLLPLRQKSPATPLFPNSHDSFFSGPCPRLTRVVSPLPRTQC